MTPAIRFLKHRLHEELFILRQMDPCSTEDDALAVLRDQCGLTTSGCAYAASEYCVLDCPYRPLDECR